jgi:predicted esterase
MASVERHIRVGRTARYHMLGDPASAKELWIVLHGYGQLARYFLHSFDGLEDGRCIVAPEGLSRFYLDGTFSRVGATWMTREDREHEITDHVSYLDELCTEVRNACPRATQLTALGFSQGVATLCRWAMLGSTHIDRLIMWGGSMPPELDPTKLGSQWNSSVLDLVHGVDDPVVKVDVLHRNESLLRSAGLRFTTHTFRGAHTLDKLTLERLIGADS